MDRAIAIHALLLVALTWLLYKLTVLLEPRKHESHRTSEPSISSRRKFIHQRLRKHAS